MQLAETTVGTLINEKLAKTPQSCVNSYLIRTQTLGEKAILSLKSLGLY